MPWLEEVADKILAWSFPFERILSARAAGGTPAWVQVVRSAGPRFRQALDLFVRQFPSQQLAQLVGLSRREEALRKQDELNRGRIDHEHTLVFRPPGKHAPVPLRAHGWTLLENALVRDVKGQLL